MLGMPIWMENANKADILKIEKISRMATYFYKTTENLMSMYDMI